MTVKLPKPAVAVQQGDAALAARNAEPVMVTLGTAAGANLPLPIASGGTGATDAASARGNILGGAPLPVTQGGTGATSVSAARSAILGGNPLAQGEGGTGASTAAGARQALFGKSAHVDIDLYDASGGADYAAAFHAMAADLGYVRFRPGRVYPIAELTGIPADLLVIAEGATIRRPNGAALPANGRRAFIDLADVTGLVWQGGAVDGNAANNTNACQNVAASGAKDCRIRMKTINPLRSGNSWGGGFVWSNSGDVAAGTWSHLDIEAEGDGTYGVLVTASGNIRSSGWKSSGFNNGGCAIKDATVPVPASPTCTDIIIDSITDEGSGIGLEIFGYRSGVSSDGYDIFAPQHVSARISIGTVHARECSTYACAVQANGVHIGAAYAVDCGTAGQLYGSILFNSPGGKIDYARNENATGIAIELGGSTDTTVGHVHVVPGADTVIGINAGASINLRIMGGRVEGGCPNSILASGWDGAGAANWMPWKGRDLYLGPIDIVVNDAADTGVRLSNGFRRVTLDGTTFHMAAAGRALNIGSADFVSRRNVRVIEQSAANPNSWTDAVTVASATTVTIPDTATQVRVTGTTTIETIRYQSEADQAGAIRVIEAVFGSEGSGYGVDAAITISGDGTGATAIPVRSNQKVYGGYITTKGSGYTSATVSFSDADGGTGANLAATVGVSARRIGERLTLLFDGVCAVSDGAGNINLSAAYTSEAGGTLELRATNAAWSEVGR